jgi:hypothetical protein
MSGLVLLVGFQLLGSQPGCGSPPAAFMDSGAWNTAVVPPTTWNTTCALILNPTPYASYVQAETGQQRRQQQLAAKLARPGWLARLRLSSKPCQQRQPAAASRRGWRRAAQVT